MNCHDSKADTLEASLANQFFPLAFDDVVVHGTSPLDMSDWAQGFNVPTPAWFRTDRISRRETAQ